MLESHNIDAESRTDARKEKLEADAVWQLLESADQVVVAKGKSVETFQPGEANQESIINAVLGRSGSLRAPTIRIDDVFYVGFNETLYSEIPFDN
ncbi:hypothetical protein JT359_03485 [Candidatus Poribacteria bacterium]|nr:hypothetical protein [Candidatus Poribacteria bacterium]